MRLFSHFFMKFVEMQLCSPFPLISQDSGGLGCHARQITSITRSGLPCPLTSLPDHSHQMLNTRCPSSGSPDHNHRILNTGARFTLTRPHCLEKKILSLLSNFTKVKDQRASVGERYLSGNPKACRLTLFPDQPFSCVGNIYNSRHLPAGPVSALGALEHT